MEEIFCVKIYVQNTKILNYLCDFSLFMSWAPPGSFVSHLIFEKYLKRERKILE